MIAGLNLRRKSSRQIFRSKHLRRPGMRLLAASFLGLCSVGASHAGDWLIEDGEGISSYIVSSHIQIAPTSVMSVRYTCGDDQRLQITLPSGIYFKAFKVDEEVGIAWKSDHVTKFPDGATFNSETAWGKAPVERLPGSKVALSFKSDELDVLGDAARLAQSKQKVVLRLFKADLKPPVSDKDILLEFTIPTKGSTKVFEKAFSDCALDYYSE